MTAHAAIAVIGTTAGSSAPAISTTFGLVVDAVNLGGSNDTVNGVSFTGLTVSGNPNSATLATSPFTITASTVSGQTVANASTGSDPLFETEVYSSNNSAETLTISGLNAASTYQIQFLHGDGRGIGGVSYVNGTQTLTDSASNVVTTPLSFNSTTSNTCVDLTVQVSSSTSLSYAMPTAGRGPSFSGFVIETVPEPGSTVLALLSGLGFLLRRRRD